MADGGPVGALGAAAPLAALWRSVYQKAAQAAETRMGALLEEHRLGQHGRRAVVVVLSGAGGALGAGTYCDFELPWAYHLEGWALYADTAGSVVVDLLAPVPPAAWPAVTSVCGGAPPTLAGAQQARSEALAGWTTPLARGSVLRVAVTSASTVQLVTLTLFLRAL
jgi:hypothetical protein